MKQPKPKWYVTAGGALLVLALAPLILVGLIILLMDACFRELPKARKEWKQSEYRRDFGGKFSRRLVKSPEYRFYNAAMERGLPISYVRQAANRFAYFIFQGTVFLFPDFDCIEYDESTAGWQAGYKGVRRSLEEAYAGLLAKLGSPPELPVKLLVERAMLPIADLRGVALPDYIFLTWSYETAFENEDSQLKMMIPQNAGQLYEMMCRTPDLCGTFELTDDAILWRLYENAEIRLSVAPQDCCFAVNKVRFGRLEPGNVHWHPTAVEMYNQVCMVGKRGNVLVIAFVLGFTGVLYMGRKEKCPYDPHKKHRFRKFYYLEAKEYPQSEKHTGAESI